MTIATRLNPLYDVKLIVDGRQHFYQIGADEKWHPGVTTALGMINKPALIPWAAKMVSENIKEALMEHWATPGTEDRDKQHLSKEQIERICLEGKNIYKKKSQAAADVGTRAHKAIDLILHGEPYQLDDDIKIPVEAFLDWKGRQTLTFELGDTRIGSRLFGYGGSLDMVAFDGNEAILIDLKTSNGIYPEMGYQIGAYSQAFKETYGIEVKEAMILRIGKDKPEFEVKKVGNISACLEGFLAALKLYQLSKWQIFEEVI